MTRVTACHLLITGHVQGVFFRQTTLHQARRLGVSGWVRNLPDGRVEVKAWGNGEAVNALARWCHTGPANALVTDVSIEETHQRPRSLDFTSARIS